MKNISKCGFTLAEVLITLGVIGVISAMTLPSLISNYKKYVTEIKIKTTYSKISNVMQKVNYENNLMFAPEELGEYNGFDYNLSKVVFEKYFANNLKIIKRIDKNKRYQICNYEGKGCYTNPQYYWMILDNNTALGFAIDSLSGKISLIIVTEPAKEKVISGKSAFGFSVFRDIRENNYNMNIATRDITEQNREQIKNWCIQEQKFSNGATSDREFYCSRLIYNNNWKIPDDYPIRF